MSQSASATPGAVSRILTSDNVKTPATLTAQSAGRGTGHRDLLITQAPVITLRLAVDRVKPYLHRLLDLDWSLTICS